MKMSRFLFPFGYHDNIDIQNGQNTLLYVGPKGFWDWFDNPSCKDKDEYGGLVESDSNPRPSECKEDRANTSRVVKIILIFML